MNINDIINRLRGSRLLVDSSWALTGSVLGKGLSLIAGIAVARFLGKETFGEYGMIKNTMVQIAVFSTLGLGYTGTRFIAKYVSAEPERIRGIIRVIYAVTLSASCLLALLTFLFSKEIAAFLDVPGTSGAFRYTAFIVIFNALTTAQIGILSGFKDFKVIARNNTLSGILTFLTSVIFTWLWNFYGALLALLVSVMFNAVINAFSIRRITSPYVRCRDCRRYYRELLSFSIPIALQESLYSVVAWTLSFLMIKLSDYGELGLFQAAAQWASIILFVPGVLKNVVLSHFSSSEDTSELRKKMVLINFTATFLPFLVISVLSGPITAFYGDSYSGLPFVLTVSCLTSVFASVAGVLLYEIIATGHTWMSFFIRLFRDVSILAAVYFLLRYQVSPMSASLTVVSVQCMVSALFIPTILLFLKRL